jgi:hypothetical protein
MATVLKATSAEGGTKLFGIPLEGAIIAAASCLPTPSVWRDAARTAERGTPDSQGLHLAK